MEEVRPLVAPRKLQKFEIKNENDSQKQLREKAIIQDFRMEIEMEKLRVESFIERARKIDQELEELIKSKYTGLVLNFLSIYGEKILKETRRFPTKDGKIMKNG